MPNNFVGRKDFFIQKYTRRYLDRWIDKNNKKT